MRHQTTILNGAVASFMPDIRMRLHLDRIPSGKAREEKILIQDAASLGELVTAYRRTQSRVETSLSNPFSVPMTVADVAENLHRFSDGNRQAFEDYAAGIKEQADDIITWEVPAYAIGDGKLFLLDGNHRAVATYLVGKPFRLELVVLHGPVDRKILYPLKHWDGGLLRFPRRWGLG